MRANTRRYYSSTPLMKRIFRNRSFRIPFSKSTARGNARLNCAAFPKRRIHWCSLRIHGDAEEFAGPNRVWKKIAAAPALASALEYKSKQRQLSGATRRDRVVFAGRPQTS